MYRQNLKSDMNVLDSLSEIEKKAGSVAKKFGTDVEKVYDSIGFDPVDYQLNPTSKHFDYKDAKNMAIEILDSDEYMNKNLSDIKNNNSGSGKLKKKIAGVILGAGVLASAAYAANQEDVKDNLEDKIKVYGEKVSDFVAPSNFIKSAYADSRDGTYFCNPDNFDMAKDEYSKEVNKINVLINSYLNSHENVTSDDRSRFITPYLETVGKKAACLKEGFGVDADSIAKFTPEVKEIFSENMDELMKVAPSLVNHATVPEFGDSINDLYSYAMVGVDTTQKAKNSSSDLSIILATSFGVSGAGAYFLKKKLLDNKSNLFHQE